MNKLDNVKNKTTQEQLSDARNLLEKWANPPLARKVELKSNDGMHRTMIKTDHGIRRGVVEKVTAFPLGLYNILERKDVGSRAQQILDKRSDCAWDNFEDFKESSTSICFVEHVIDIDTNTMFLECSCIDGLKGSAPCVHKLAMEMYTGIRPTPNLAPVSQFSKKAGRPKKSANQPRF